MLLTYKNNRLEKTIIVVNALTAAVITVFFAMLFGYDEPYLPARVLYTTHAVLLCIFIAEKIVRLLNVNFKFEYLRAFWFEIPLLVILALI